MESNKLILAGGILAGATAGILLGILMAPDKGSNTRRKLFEKGEDYLDEFKDKLDDLAREAGEKIKEITHACNCEPKHGNASQPAMNNPKTP